MHKEICGNIGKMAAAALRAEAGATPKPGLVDRENSGAHTDMDYPLFLASCRALESYFVRCAEIGAAHCAGDSDATQTTALCGDGTAKSAALCAGDTDTGSDAAQTAQQLREAGLAAEEAMFAATGGVNTHKGLIFSMGVLCFCLGEALSESQQACLLGEALSESQQARLNVLRSGGQQAWLNPQKTRDLQKRCAEVSESLLLGQSEMDTHGAAVRKSTGIGGIREEALSGFNSAFSIGYPALKEALDRGFDMNSALVRTLLVLMTRAEDSNAVYRGGREGLLFMRRQAEAILRETDLNSEEGMERVRAFDRECTARNLSPGGSADLLALSVMIYMINEIGRIER